MVEIGVCAELDREFFPEADDLLDLLSGEVRESEDLAFFGETPLLLHFETRDRAREILRDFYRNWSARFVDSTVFVPRESERVRIDPQIEEGAK